MVFVLIILKNVLLLYIVLMVILDVLSRNKQDSKQAKQRIGSSEMELPLFYVSL